MRVSLSLALFLVTALVQAQESYAILGALKTSPEGARQPTWIAVRSKAGLLHVPAGGIIVSLPVGRITLHHIDFGADESNGIGTIHLSSRHAGSPVSFSTSKGTITFVGILLIPGNESRFFNTKITTADAKKTLEWACAENPELLARLPVRFIGKDHAEKRVRVKCQN